MEESQLDVRNSYILMTEIIINIVMMGLGHTVNSRIFIYDHLSVLYCITIILFIRIC